MGERIAYLPPKVALIEPTVIHINPEVKTPISREAYFIQLHNQIDYCEEQITIFENKITEIRGIMSRIEGKEDLGMRMSFYEEDGGLSNVARERPPLGFAKGVK